MTQESSVASASDPLRERIAPVLGRTPSGIFILTAADGDGHETGMLASWVQQASFSPPMVSVAVNRKRYLHDWLKKSPHVALSMLAESQSRFLKHFGRGFEPEDVAFEGVQIIRGETGLPVLVEALGYLEGRVTGQAEAGDHVVYLVEILSAGSGENIATQKPMVHLRKNGFNY
jgi:flavin reductase (DIM6/NTAB) family NADH-FMN oxidoreductase RutF